MASVNPAKLAAFIQAYVGGLQTAIKQHRHRYSLRYDDTAETYALRVACTVTELFQTRGTNAVDVSAEGFRNACLALGIDHSEKSINHFLEVENAES